MARLLFPVTLSAAAFAAAWWAGGLPSTVSFGGNQPPAETDSASATGSSVSTGSALARRAAFLAEIENPGSDDIRRLLEDSRLDGDAILHLSKRWAARDPAGFWKWLKFKDSDNLRDYSDPDRYLWGELVRMAFAAWFRADPEASIAAWRKTAFGAKQEAAAGILAPLFGADESTRRKLLPFLDELVPELRDLSQLPGAGNRSDMAAQLLKLPAGKGRDTLLAANLGNWMTGDWKAASAWSSGLQEPLKSRMMEDFARTAFKSGSLVNPQDPKQPPSCAAPECFEQARQWFETEAPPELKRELSGSFVRTFTATNPAGALAWVNENLSARPMTRAIGEVLQKQVWKDPAAARALVEGLPPGGVRQRAAFSAVGRITPESVSWLISQTDRDDHQWVKLAYSWAGEQPEVYRKYLESADPANLPGELVKVGIQQLVRKDPPGTMDWVLQRKNPAETAAALRMWGGSDPPAAAAWLKDHADAADWSAGTGTVTNGYFQRAPSDAVDWAVSLPAGPLRENAVGALRKSLAGNTALKTEERAALEERLGKP